jgi:hypothetical protein
MEFSVLLFPKPLNEWKSLEKILEATQTLLYKSNAQLPYTTQEQHGTNHHQRKAWRAPRAKKLKEWDGLSFF